MRYFDMKQKHFKTIMNILRFIFMNNLRFIFIDFLRLLIIKVKFDIYGFSKKYMDIF